jgi:DNA-binding response OmpR family regulator
MAKKILIVDDEPDILKVVIFRLKKSGYEVLSAVNGEEAIELIKANVPDLIFLDLRLPLLSGAEVCKQLKSNEKLKHIPIILFTASADTVKDILAKTKADDYIIKPFEPEVLLEKIRKFIG